MEFTAHGTRFTINFYFDKAHDAYLKKGNVNYKPLFVSLVCGMLNKLYIDNPELIDAENMKIKLWVSKFKKQSQVPTEQSHLNFHEEESGLKVIGINLLNFKERGFDIIKYLEKKVPVDKWFLYKSAYGKTITFSDGIHHELRHAIDEKIKEFEGMTQRKTTVYGIEYLLRKFLDYIRQEAYPKLFDTTGDVTFFRDKLTKIRINLMLAVKQYPLSGKYKEGVPKEFLKKRGFASLKEPWMQFLWVTTPGNQHYYLARYMSFIIAYNLMDRKDIINEKLKLTVKDINTAIDKGIPIKQPPENIKKTAGEAIRKSDPEEFLKLFTDSANSLGLAKLNIPLDIKYYKKLLQEAIEIQKILNEKKYEHLVAKLKAKTITFYQLKKEIEKMAA